jgi:hypothetical protein
VCAWQAAEEYNYRYHAILSAVPLCAFVTLRSVVSVRGMRGMRVVMRVVRVMSHVVRVMSHVVRVMSRCRSTRLWFASGLRQGE